MHSPLQKRRAKIQPGQFFQRRAHVLFFLFFLLLSVMAVRAVIIHILPYFPDSLGRIADQQYSKQLELSPYRGKILDRRGEALAISIKKSSFAINPRAFTADSLQLRRLSQITGVSEQPIRSLAERSGHFVWLKRKVSDSERDSILALQIAGLSEISEPSRYYPSGEAAAPFLGLVGLDNKGLMGIEQQFDHLLSGGSAIISPERDALGRIIYLDHQKATPEKPGKTIQLTIDKAIQEIAEDELERGVKNAKAKAGFGIVSDPHTGQILAIANYPSFDPNFAKLSNLNQAKNRALLDAFEPGSFVKTLVVAEALSRKLVKESDLFDCQNGVYQTHAVQFQDAHPPPTRYLTVSDTLVYSSNVCIYKIAQKLGPELLYQGLMRFGIGAGESHLGFPGEAGGSISTWRVWRPIRFANVSFGQGLMTTALEIVQAVSIIANGGILMRPFYVEKIVSPENTLEESFPPQIISQVVSPEVARRMRSVLRSVVDKKTHFAQPASYTAGGKTGTAQKIDERTKAYSHSKHIASFAGFSPAEDPHLVIFIAIDEPGITPHYGALWAAPVFAKLAERTLRYLNVAQDRVEKRKIAEKDHETSAKLQ